MIQITRVTPKQLGYTDRGIVKWFGMMLSDHSEALKQSAQHNHRFNIKPKPEMTETEISNILYQAFIHQSPVSIQAHIIKNGYYFKDLECKVSGYADDQIYLLLKDGRSVSCHLDNIRNIAFTSVHP